MLTKKMKKAWKSVQRGGYAVVHGDSLKKLRFIPDNSVDAIVTDPPYGIEFMGAEWDGFSTSQAFQKWCESWCREALRVLKPGGHIVAFGGTRMWHRLCSAMEDAGFEIRDTLMFMHGQGFPKSMNVAKAIDATIKVGGSHSRHLKRVEQEGAGKPYKLRQTNNGIMGEPVIADRKVFSASTTEARQWEGWGTAMKPAHESMCLARKPFVLSVELPTIVEILSTLEARLWLLLSAKTAAKDSESSRHVSRKDMFDIAGWTVEEKTRTKDALSEAMDTSQFASAVRTCLSTVTSWKSILDAACEPTNTSIIETRISPTIDWLIWKSCLSEITLEGIIRVVIRQPGKLSNALLAVKTFNAGVVLIENTLTLSATVRAMSKDHTGFPDEAGLRPEVEPVVLARKPLAQTTVAKQVLKTGTGALNIDGCRVSMGEEYDPSKVQRQQNSKGVIKGAFGAANLIGKTIQTYKPGGRWPANVVLQHSEGCECVGTREVKTGTAVQRNGGGQKIGGNGIYRGSKGGVRPDQGFGTKGKESVEKWRCTPDCPVRLLDKQAEGVSRFYYTAKPRKKERNAGMPKGEENRHPTLKSLDLMRWLCRLVTPKGGLVLDPFVGSGTTVCAAGLEGFRALGIERDRVFARTAYHRASHWLRGRE